MSTDLENWSKNRSYMLLSRRLSLQVTDSTPTTFYQAMHRADRAAYRHDWKAAADFLEDAERVLDSQQGESC